MADNEFTYFLLIGLFILAIMLLMFNGGFTIGTGLTTDVVIPDPIDTDLTGAVLIGEFTNDRSRTFGFDIDVSNIEVTETAEIGDRELINGLLFGKTEFRRLATGEITDIDVRFEVVRSNRLAPLKLKVNGETITEIKDEGVYDISVPSDVITSDNLIVIEPDSSLWQIWAPALYRLENIDVEVKFYEEETDSFSFDLSSEIETMTDASLNLFLDENAGDLEITLNNQLIFDDAPRNTESMDATNLKLGTNTVTFEGERNSLFEGDGVLTVFFTDVEEKVASTEIDINQNEGKFFDKGIITFDVPRVEKSGGLVVIIARNGEEIFTEFEKAESRRYSFTFVPEQIGSGEVDLIVRGSEGSQFYVKNLRVELR